MLVTRAQSGHDLRVRALVAGAHVVLAGAEPVLYVERGGRGLQVLVDDDPRLRPCVEALTAAVGPRRLVIGA